MNITSRIITVKDVYDAIIVDGYNHLRQTWVTFKEFDGKIKPIGACLVGMAAVNLGVVAENDWLSEASKGELKEALDAREYYGFAVDEEVDIFGLYEALNEIVVGQDANGNPIDLPSTVSDHSYSRLGDALVDYNDAREDETDAYIPRNDVVWKYTYEELSELARDLMTPHFDRALTVTQLDYTDAANLLPY